MTLLAGRNFNGGDTKTAPAVAIVNQTLAHRFFPNLNPMGKTFRIDDIGGKPGPPIEVVGVVKDSKYDRSARKLRPSRFFRPRRYPAQSRRRRFELRTGDPALGPGLGCPGRRGET